PPSRAARVDAVGTVPPDGRGRLPPLRRPLPWPFRWAAGAVGRSAPRRPPGRVRSRVVRRRIRPPAVAGLFYPAQPDVLAALVDRLVAAGRPEEPPPAPLGVPHAGYQYSRPRPGVAHAPG